MMLSSSLMGVLVVIGGIAIVIQQRIMSGVTQQTGDIWVSMLLNSLIGISVILIVGPLRRGMDFFSGLQGLTAWQMLLPGCLGTVFVLAMIAGHGRLGAATTLALVIASQLTAAVLVDTWLEGAEMARLAQQGAGALTMVAGAWLIMRV